MKLSEQEQEDYEREKARGDWEADQKFISAWEFFLKKHGRLPTDDESLDYQNESD